jgi:hypothetical protein
MQAVGTVTERYFQALNSAPPTMTNSLQKTPKMVQFSVKASFFVEVVISFE